MSKDFAKTIGPRTRTRWCDDASARCNASSQLDPRSASSASMPPSTTHSIFNATSSPGPRCGPSEPKRRRTGKMPAQHEIWLVLVSLSAGDRYRDKAAQEHSFPLHPDARLLAQSDRML